MSDEHIVTRVNDHYYVCGKCGQAGSERWAILHQFPAAPCEPCQKYADELVKQEIENRADPVLNQLGLPYQT